MNKDVRVGDVRVGDVRVGDVRVGDEVVDDEPVNRGGIVRQFPQPWPVRHPVWPIPTPWPPPAPPPPPEQHLPVLAAPEATLLRDRYDSDLDWSIPVPALSMEVDDFSFAAVQDGSVSETGTPSHHATLTVTLSFGDSTDVATARGQAGVTISTVAPQSVDVALSLPWTADDGTLSSTAVPATTAVRPDGKTTVTVALMGPQVIQAAAALMSPTASPCGLTLTTSYQAWRETQVYRLPVVSSAPIQRIHPTVLVTHDLAPLSTP